MIDVDLTAVSDRALADEAVRRGLLPLEHADEALLLARRLSNMLDRALHQLVALDVRNTALDHELASIAALSVTRAFPDHPTIEE